MALKEKKCFKQNTKSNNHKENKYCIDCIVSDSSKDTIKGMKRQATE